MVQWKPLSRFKTEDTIVTGGLSFESGIQTLRWWLKLILQPRYDTSLHGTLRDSIPRSRCMFSWDSSALIFTQLALKHKIACMETAATCSLPEKMRRTDVSLPSLECWLASKPATSATHIYLIPCLYKCSLPFMHWVGTEYCRPWSELFDWWSSNHILCGEFCHFNTIANNWY